MNDDVQFAEYTIYTHILNSIGSILHLFIHTNHQKIYAPKQQNYNPTNTTTTGTTGTGTQIKSSTLLPRFLLVHEFHRYAFYWDAPIGWTECE